MNHSMIRYILGWIFNFQAICYDFSMYCSGDLW